MGMCIRLVRRWKCNLLPFVLFLLPTFCSDLIALTIRHHKNKRTTFLVSAEVHPQTREIVKTRADTLGIQVHLFNGSH